MIVPKIYTYLNFIDLFRNQMISCYLVTKLCPTLCDPMDCSPTGSSIHGVFQAKILHFLLQGIFLTQGLNPHFLHWQVGSKPLSHKGSP